MTSKQLYICLAIACIIAIMGGTYSQQATAEGNAEPIKAEIVKELSEEGMAEVDMLQKEISKTYEQAKTTIKTAPPPPRCNIALTPTGGSVLPGLAPPLRVSANTDQGCVAKYQGPPTVVPVNAFAPTCVQLPAAPANSIVVTCSGVPTPQNPPANPINSSLILGFICECPNGNLAPNGYAEAYDF